jgi:hypothetical protein
MLNNTQENKVSIYGQEYLFNINEEEFDFILDDEDMYFDTEEYIEEDFYDEFFDDKAYIKTYYGAYQLD